MLNSLRVVATSLCISIGVAGCRGGDGHGMPIASGDYQFLLRESEFQGQIPADEVSVKVRGRHITVTSDHRSSIFPNGLVEEGDLMWHASSRQWIIGTSAADATAAHVGGCSDGPTVIDLEKRIYWTC